jgi:hypothetical protein
VQVTAQRTRVLDYRYVPAPHFERAHEVELDGVVALALRHAELFQVELQPNSAAVSTVFTKLQSNAVPHSSNRRGCCARMAQCSRMCRFVSIDGSTCEGTYLAKAIESK